MSETSKYSFHGSIIGNAAGIVQGEQISSQYNYAPENQQTLAEVAAEIQQLLKQLEQTNPTATEAEQKTFLTKVASDLATQAQSNPIFKNKLVKCGQYLNDAAANGLIGEAVVTVLKLALRSAGIPIS